MQSFYKFFLCSFLLANVVFVKAQTCSGSLGDPIVNFDFGSGSNPGNPLPATNYTYTNADCPIDGSHTVRSNTNNCFGNTWHTVSSNNF